MSRYTDEDFTRAMREAVAERGSDWVYPRHEWLAADGETCAYSLPDGSPACIVGLALHKLDPTLVPDNEDTRGADNLLRHLGFSGSVAEAAWSAQQAQDDQYPWGVVLNAFYLKALEETDMNGEGNDAA